ncbi:MAG: hypothetical protein HRT90_11770 [Candidatus Margulisbacteria bacterium]|nr:hypothetical protein [Candidatus Margulisiibacteriota bacterium]
MDYKVTGYISSGFHHGRYDGYYMNGNRHGHGTFEVIVFDGQTYTGEWVDDKKCGQGEEFRDGISSFNGEFKNGEPYSGVFKYPLPRMVFNSTDITGW